MDLLARMWLAAQRCWPGPAGRQPHMQHSPGREPGGNYQAYMVRFWRTSPAVPWRAAVIEPHHDAIRYFANREALYAFLDAQIDDRSASSEQS